MLSIGFFADGTSNYGGSWNGVTGSVTGLFYGDSSQLVAQIVGCATLVGFVFSFSFVLNWILDIIIGQRVSIATEVAGLDLPEMGQLGYPEFMFRPEPDFMQAAGKNGGGVASHPADSSLADITTGRGRVGSVFKFRFSCGIFLKQQGSSAKPCCPFFSSSWSSRMKNITQLDMEPAGQMFLAPASSAPLSLPAAIGPEDRPSVAAHVQGSSRA